MKNFTIIMALLLAVASAQAVTYEYDAAGRLVKVVYDNGMETRYTYDLNGNMIGRKTDAVNTVDEEGAPAKASVSPQPSSEMASITLKEWEGAKVDVTMVDVNGKVVQRVSRYVQNGIIDIDVRHLTSGAYQVSLVNGHHTMTTTVNVVH